MAIEFATPDELRPWLQVDPLTLEQAVKLAVGGNPTFSRPTPLAYTPLFEAVIQAIERGELPAIRSNDPLEGRPYSLYVPKKTRVTQSDMRTWLASRQINSAFFYLTPADDWPPAAPTTPAIEKPLRERERTTLLCIIGALATHAQLDLSQPYKAGDAIAAMLPGDVKLPGRTIGDHLKVVVEAMGKRTI